MIGGQLSCLRYAGLMIAVNNINKLINDILLFLSMF